ncbi:NUDIX domain-containing protein, partial [Candidatus Parcubacteria bacterium]|nr:NUDIX domain-containing protein [Candidatus Parcubacteria bacterium]
VVKSGLADKVVLGNIKDKYKIIERFKPDVICLGYDQKIFTEKLKEKLQKFGLSKTRIIRLKSYKKEKYKSSKFKIMHTSVGAIIKNKEGKILMIDRAAFPYGWACPAGHVDENETPEQALVREIKEEVNLIIRHAATNGVHANENNNVNYKLLIHEYVDWNECVKEVRGHDWYVYEVLQWSGEVKRSERETKNIGWFSPNEIKKLQLEEIWRYWFEKLNII